MNFSKRKIIFISLLQAILFSAFIWFTGTIDRNRNMTTHAADIHADTTAVESVQGVMAGEKEKKINKLDQDSPKTVNLILYLIYELTFKKMN